MTWYRPTQFTPNPLVNFNVEMLTVFTVKYIGINKELLFIMKIQKGRGPIDGWLNIHL